MMISSICVTLPEQVIERPDLFASDVRCPKFNETPTDTVNGVNTMKEIIQTRSKRKKNNTNQLYPIETIEEAQHCARVSAENYRTQIESVLFALAELSYNTSISQRLQILSMLPKEVARNMCCDQAFKESLAHIQTEAILNLTSNFIRERANGGPRETPPRLKICGFCDGVIRDRARRHAELCNDIAERVDRLLRERLSSHRANSTRTNGSDDAELRSIAEEDTETRTRLEDYYKNRRERTNSRASTGVIRDKHPRHNTPYARETADSKDVESGRSAVETNDRDGIVGGNPSRTANGDRGFGETKASAAGARSDGVARSADTPAERIRAVRDNNPYRRGRGGRIDKDRRDRRSPPRDVEEKEAASGERVAAVGKRGRVVVGDTTTAEENGGERRRSPYRRRRAEVTRLPDSGVREIGRLDPSEGKNVEMARRKPARRPEVNGGRDRRENEDGPVARRDGKRASKEEEGGNTTSPTRGKDAPFESEKTVNSLDDAEKGRRAVNEEEKLPTYDERHKDAIDGGRDVYVTKEWKAGSSGSIEYQLSNVHFVKLGWTLLPVAKAMRKIVQYEAKPAKPHLDWFKKYRNKGTEYYDDEITPFLRFHLDGSGELFYPNGVLAVRVYRPENRQYDMYTVFTPGGKDALGIERQSQILAIFDAMGNGVVLDQDGAARLSYNQIGGIFTDNPAGLPLVWTWNANPRESTLEIVYTERSNDRLQMEFLPRLTKTSGNAKKPISQSSPRNKEKKVAEVQEPVVEERQEQVGNESGVEQTCSEREDVVHIKIICMKLNEFLGLRIIDRRNIALRFSARNKSVRMELGTILNFNKEVASCTIEATDWKSDMLKCRFQERLPTKLDSDSSLLELSKEYRKVKRFAKERNIMITKYRPYSSIRHRHIRNEYVRS